MHGPRNILYRQIPLAKEEGRKEMFYLMMYSTHFSYTTQTYGKGPLRQLERKEGRKYFIYQCTNINLMTHTHTPGN